MSLKAEQKKCGARKSSSSIVERWKYRVKMYLLGVDSHKCRRIVRSNTFSNCFCCRKTLREFQGQLTLNKSVTLSDNLKGSKIISFSTKVHLDSAVVHRPSSFVINCALFRSQCCELSSPFLQPPHWVPVFRSPALRQTINL